MITGASGFVGANLSAKLLSLGALVTTYQRDLTMPNSISYLGVEGRVNSIAGEITDLENLERTLAENAIDSVFHLAAQSLVGPANISPLETFETNIRGTYTVLEAARRSPTVERIVVASSDKAYGSHDMLPFREDFALNGMFPYDVSKACGDLLAQSFSHSFQLPVAIARVSNTYGAGDLNFSRIIPGTIKAVLSGTSPIIRSNGTPVREFIHVNDVIDGYLLLAVEISRSRGHAFNFATNDPVNILDLTNKIIEISGNGGRITPEIASETRQEYEIDAKYLSEEKMLDRFGWRPSIKLDDGLAMTIDWYRHNLSRLNIT